MTCACIFDLFLPFRTLPAVFEIRPTTMPPQPCVSTGMNLEHFHIKHISKLSIFSFLFLNSSHCFSKSLVHVLVVLVDVTVSIVTHNDRERSV